MTLDLLPAKSFIVSSTLSIFHSKQDANCSIIYIYIYIYKIYYQINAIVALSLRKAKGDKKE